MLDCDAIFLELWTTIPLQMAFHLQAPFIWPPLPQFAKGCQAFNVMNPGRCALCPCTTSMLLVSGGPIRVSLSIEVRNDSTPFPAWPCSGRISSLRQAYRCRVVMGHKYAEVVFSNCAGSRCAIRQRKLRIGAVKPQLGGGGDSSFRLLHMWT